jgi:DUF4097 and DUF4098 domain-containing protein YvlB
MSTQSFIKYIGGVAFAFILLTACGGGGGINFTIDGNGWDNWPWPWQTNVDFFVQKIFSQNVTIAGHTNLWLDGVNGEVEIIGQPGSNSVQVTASARVGSDTLLDAQAGLNQLEVSLTSANGGIVIQTTQPGNTGRRQYIVDYTITVPSDLAVNISLVNGHVTVNDIGNSIYIVLENGNVDFTDIYGDATASLDNGSIRGTLTLPPGGEAMLSTVNGDIDLDMPVSTSAEIFAQVSNGTISRDNIDLTGVISTNQSLQGIMGDGEGFIDVRTVNGDISLTGINI